MAVYQPLWVVRARHWWRGYRATARRHSADLLVALAIATWFYLFATVMLGWSA